MAIVEYEVRDRIAYITMNRPDKLNAINAELRTALFDAFEDVKYNDDIWVAIITGNGTAFSTGHDLVEMGTGAHSGPPDPRTTDDLYVFELGIFKPIIAAINGTCLAQGGGIALASDIRIASERARFGWPQVKRGISSVSGPCMLAQRLPFNIAMEILLSGEFISAEQALHLNLVNKVVPHEQLIPAAEEVAKKILVNAPLSVRAIKEVAVRGLGMDIQDRIRLARLMAEKVLTSADAQEGLAAFREKRAPAWQGR
ncbi:MAG: enoyl-CoA hydratase/isomerase family protein [Chloroflexi bacterium]|nr:enoyl-CoA hydratase/isomerase family protein [Chloroflexota bacterium]